VTTYAAPIAWVLLIIVSVTSFSITNLTVCAMGLVLTFVNLMGYIKCEKNHDQKLKGFVLDQAKSKLSV
jgi:hypothetical protein